MVPWWFLGGSLVVPWWFLGDPWFGALVVALFMLVLSSPVFPFSETTPTHPLFPFLSHTPSFAGFALVLRMSFAEFDEGLLGLAWVGSKGNSPGGICQEGATLSGDFLYTNTGFSTQTNFGERVPDLTAYLVMSHELGHNFGSSHDSEEQSSKPTIQCAVLVLVLVLVVEQRQRVLLLLN